MELTKITPTGKNSTVTVSDSIFRLKPSSVLLSQAVRVYLSNQRQGSAQAQTRGEVSRTKKKMYRQKGTGGARHGAQSAPIFVGGGAAHGPTGNQNWSRTLSQKQKTLALRQALSLQSDRIMVSDMLLELSHKTKHGSEFLKAVAKDKSNVLLVFELSQKSVPRVFGNIRVARLQTPERLTTYDILRADAIIFTTAALRKLQDRLMPDDDLSSKQTTATLPVKSARLNNQNLSAKKLPTAKPKSTFANPKTSNNKDTSKKTKVVTNKVANK